MQCTLFLGTNTFVPLSYIQPEIDCIEVALFYLELSLNLEYKYTARLQE